MHTPIPIFSQRWFFTSFVTFGVIALVIMLAKQLSRSQQEYVRKAIGMILLAEVILIHPYEWYLGVWNLESSLPLHLCGITAIIASICMLFPNQLLYEFLLYWGVAGSLHSLLTPELTKGDRSLLLPDYFLAHGGMGLSVLYLTYITGYRPTKNSWWKMLIYTQFFAAIVGTANYFLHANYMYLCAPPIAKNPLVIGKWPWYILVFEVAALAHFYITYLIFRNGQKQLTK